MPTEADIKMLTPQQLLAIDLLSGGSNLTDAAKTVKVARQTVSEWVNHNFLFRAQLNKRRNELWEQNGERLRSLIPRALDALEAGLIGDRAVYTAVQILRASGLYGVPLRRGETDPEMIEADEASSKQMKDLCRSLSGLSS